MASVTVARTERKPRPRRIDQSPRERQPACPYTSLRHETRTSPSPGSMARAIARGTRVRARRLHALGGCFGALARVLHRGRPPRSASVARGSPRARRASRSRERASRSGLVVPVRCRERVGQSCHSCARSRAAPRLLRPGARLHSLASSSAAPKPVDPRPSRALVSLASRPRSHAERAVLT